MKRSNIITWIAMPVLVAGLSIAGWYALAQEVTGGDEGGRKVTVKVKVTENGNTTETVKEIELAGGQDVEAALREMGVFDDIGVSGDSNDIEIIIRSGGDAEKPEGHHFRSHSRYASGRPGCAKAGQHCKPGCEEKCCAPRAFLGVYTEAAGGDAAAGEGAVVKDVVEGSAAEKAGLKVGDVITAVGDRKVAGPDDLIGAVRALEPGKEVEVSYVRDGKSGKKKVTLTGNEDQVFMHFAPHMYMMEKHLGEVDWGKLGSELEERIRSYDWKGLEKRMKEKMSEEDWEKFGKELEEHLRGAGKALEQHLEKAEAYAYSHGSGRGEKNVRISIRIEDVTIADEKELKGKTGVQAESSLKLNSMLFAPNPSDGRFDLKFELPEKGKTTIRVFDSSGRRVYDETLHDFSGAYSQSIDISAEPDGIYFITIEQNGNKLSKKVVVQR